MSLPITTYNAPYTFVASLCAAIVTVLAMLGGMCLMMFECYWAEFNTEMPRRMAWFSSLGLGGVAVMWLLFLAVIAAMFLVSRQRVAVTVAIVTSIIFGGHFGLMFLSCLRILFFSGTYSVSG